MSFSKTRSISPNLGPEYPFKSRSPIISDGLSPSLSPRYFSSISPSVRYTMLHYTKAKINHILQTTLEQYEQSVVVPNIFAVPIIFELLLDAKKQLDTLFRSNKDVFQVALEELLSEENENLEIIYALKFISYSTSSFDKILRTIEDIEDTTHSMIRALSLMVQEMENTTHQYTIYNELVKEINQKQRVQHCNVPVLKQKKVLSHRIKDIFTNMKHINECLDYINDSQYIRNDILNARAWLECLTHPEHYNYPIILSNNQYSNRNCC